VAVSCALGLVLVAGSVTIAAAVTGDNGTEKTGNAQKDRILAVAGTRPGGADKPVPSPPVSVPDPAWPLGAADDPEAPIAPADFTATSHWTGRSGATYVVLYAGAEGADPSHGAAYVLRYSIDTGLLQGSRKLAVPRGEGSLHVDGDTGTGQVLLHSANGTAHRFDPSSDRLE
jgi:hypothetical protein